MTVNMLPVLPGLDGQTVVHEWECTSHPVYVCDICDPAQQNLRKFVHVECVDASKFLTLEYEHLLNIYTL